MVYVFIKCIKSARRTVLEMQHDTVAAYFDATQNEKAFYLPVVNDPKKTEHLLSLDGAKERLHLFKANLLEEGSFDSIVEGCVGVFHTASPFYYGVTDPQVKEKQEWYQWNNSFLNLSWETYLEAFPFYRPAGPAELIDPALKGTLNVLSSCAKTPTVKRVVVTSSIAAVVYSGKPRTPEVVVDETWFSNQDICKELKENTEKLKSIFFPLSVFFQLWYVLSKTLAEEAAWKFAKEKGMDIVTINPAMVIGPLLQPTLNASAAAILNLINGAQIFPNFTMGWVHVKDVAEAHIQAYEIPSANGRYCLAERTVHYSEIVKILKDLFPDFQLPVKCADDHPFMPTYQISKEKAKSLGIEFIPLEESLKETVESLKEKKFLSP
ncbi:Cinnamoyl-CoA reductase 1 [Vitis vinifera]|uniref:Cinnamoyl-CoA reductase 1 n=1 Tax=Vitis vinifera TaxID=29760 RepID=A0A438CPG1_VITVI|nr:Cinnamoyl-CoA reductase 1 [Vitis vinifera]